MNNPIIRGDKTDATYNSEVESDLYKGYPCIEALPKMLTPDDLYKIINYFPKYNEDSKNLPLEKKIHCIFNLDQLFLGNSLHVDLYRKIDCVIKRGYSYRSRNPLIESYWNGLPAETHSGIDFIDPANYFWGFDEKNLGFPLIGMTGIGKTTGIKKVLRTIPQVIQHQNYMGKAFPFTQLVWVIVETPHDGTPKGLCINFFKTIDEIFNKNYYENYALNGRATVDVMFANVKRLCKIFAIGYIVFEETENLSVSKSQGIQKLLNFFVELSNCVNVPITMIGTYKTLYMFSSSVRSGRRVNGIGVSLWNRMEYKGAIWKELLPVVWGYNFLEKNSPLSPEIEWKFYEESQGITDLLIKLYILCQTRALLNNLSEISVDLIDVVSKDSLHFVSGAINALKSSDLEALSKYDDLYKVEYKNAYDKEVLGLRDLENHSFLAKDTVKSNQSRKITIINNTEDKSEFSGEKLDDNPVELSQIADKKDLRYIFNFASENGISTYEAMANAGYMRTPDEFLKGKD